MRSRPVSTKARLESRPTPLHPPTAVVVMLAEEDGRVVVIDLATHPCGQHLLDDLVEGGQLVAASHLRGLPTLGPDD